MRRSLLQLPPVIWICVAVAHAAVRAVAAEEGEANWNIRGECQMVLIPQNIALPLIDVLLDETKIETGYAKIQEMIAKGEAKLAANLVVQLRNRQKAIAESVEEMRFAREFDPPQLPQNAPTDPKVLKEWPVTGITPTAFETRNIGTTLELDAGTDDGHLIYAMSIAQHVRFLRWAKTDAGKLANGERLEVEQPIFHTLKSMNSVMLHSGERILVGVHKAPESPEMLELFFLRLILKKVEER